MSPREFAERERRQRIAERTVHLVKLKAQREREAREYPSHMYRRYDALDAARAGRFLTTPEVMAALGVSHAVIFNWIKSGRVNAVREKGSTRWLIPIEDVERLKGEDLRPGHKPGVPMW